MNWILKVKTSKGMRRECRLGRKAASEIMLVLLTISIVSLTTNVKPVKSEWTGTVYIRADGSIDPPDAPITTYDNVTYILTGNITGRIGIIVEKDGIIVEGASYFISVSGFDPKPVAINLTDRNGVTIKNINIQMTGFGYAIYLRNSTLTKIFSNTIIINAEGGACPGVYLEGSSNNTISGNKIMGESGVIGVHLDYYYSDIKGCNIFSYNNTINYNDINCGKYGVYIDTSYSNVVSENIIRNCDFGIYVYNHAYNNMILNNNVSYCYDGINVYNEANNNTISHNIISKCSNAGIFVGRSENCIISYNNLTRNGYGVYTSYSSRNKIYHNNFIDNAVQAYNYNSADWWDNNYPTGGNYWSDYRGTDEKSGSNQNQPGSDGIGDTPYEISSKGTTAKDNYPLMVPIPEFSSTIMMLLLLIILSAIVLVKRRFPT